MMDEMLHTHGTSNEQNDEIFGKVYDQRVVGRLTPFIKPYRRLVLVSVISMLIFIFTILAIPWLIAKGIDDFIADDNIRSLSLLFVIFLIITVTSWISNYIQEMSMVSISQGMLYDLRKIVFRHLQKLSLAFYNKTEVGRIMSRVLGDIGQLQEFMSLLIMTIGELLSLFGIVAILLLMNLKLGLFCLSVIPILILLMYFWQAYARRAFTKVRVAISIVNSAFNENISGVRVVQGMNREKLNMEMFERKNKVNLRSNNHASSLSASLLLPVDTLTALAILFVILFGSRMVVSGELGLGVLIAYIMYIQRFFDPVRHLTLQYTSFQRAMASGVRIFALLDSKPDVTDSAQASSFQNVQGSIEFDNVTFGYSHNEPILKNINFRIEAGQTTAIVGPTGAGKTTLISLITRFYDLPKDSGSILVDGHDIRNKTRKSLIRNIGVVLQEPFLFSGTIRENIKYSNTNISDQEMIEAAKTSGAHDFIMDLDDSYDAICHERGSNFSIGQRQLLNFARAIASNPSILILDEATANIDSHTEYLIQKSLSKLLDGRTAIIVAHRLSTIRNADKIIVINHGKIVETGNHKQLIANDNLYARLHRVNQTYLEMNGSPTG